MGVVSRPRQPKVGFDMDFSRLRAENREPAADYANYADEGSKD